MRKARSERRPPRNAVADISPRAGSPRRFLRRRKRGPAAEVGWRGEGSGVAGPARRASLSLEVAGRDEEMARREGAASLEFSAVVWPVAR